MHQQYRSIPTVHEISTTTTAVVVGSMIAGYVWYRPIVAQASMHDAPRCLWFFVCTVYMGASNAGFVILRSAGATRATVSVVDMMVLVGLCADAWLGEVGARLLSPYEFVNRRPRCAGNRQPSLDPMHAWHGVTRGGKPGKLVGSAERLLCGVSLQKEAKNKDARFLSAAIEQQVRVRLFERCVTEQTGARNFPFGKN